MSDALDDAAVAALYALAHGSTERLGALYGPELTRSDTVTNGSNESARGSLQIPGGASAIQALFHNHPERRNDATRQRFSDDDKGIARRLGVPSYISAGDRVMRFDPGTNDTEEVLAEFPIEEWRQQIMRTILGRSSDDPRGALR